MYVAKGVVYVEKGSGAALASTTTSAALLSVPTPPLTTLPAPDPLSLSLPEATLLVPCCCSCCCCAWSLLEMLLLLLPPCVLPVNLTRCVPLLLLAWPPVPEADADAEAKAGSTLAGRGPRGSLALEDEELPVALQHELQAAHGEEDEDIIFFSVFLISFFFVFLSFLFDFSWSLVLGFLIFTMSKPVVDVEISGRSRILTSFFGCLCKVLGWSGSCACPCQKKELTTGNNEKHFYKAAESQRY